MSRPIAQTTIAAIEREMEALGERWRIDTMHELVEAQTDLLVATNKRRAAIRLAALAILLGDCEEAVK